MQVFTPEQLSKFNGEVSTRPLYLAIDTEVYDVTAGAAFYGKGAGYNIFAGRDCARAFATNCLSQEDHFTHDLRGLSEDELKALHAWKSFFKNHQKYFKVGSVLHPSIKPELEIPGPCLKAAPKPS
ncbi:hypothetical protein BB561_005444 [Smittium simulii]|uniref:Cytochrome b5 heme-binding domain-containing protein n=1 Tax=Smittium simulii TaxID=133385 RepID=A0A2T9YAE4_9FUNG|nr:hypothetical protein BB561_005444 [Smittium simulii]